MKKIKKVAIRAGIVVGFVASVVTAARLGREYGRYEGVGVTKALLQEKFPETHEAICDMMKERNS